MPAPAIYAPHILDGQHGSAQRDWSAACELISHALVLAVDGGVVVDSVHGQRRLRPGEALLIQPPSPLRWRLSRGAGMELLIFDVCWRPWRPGRDDRRIPRRQRPEPALSTLWGVAVPALLPTSLRPVAATEIRALGDLWWRGPAERLLADARLAVLLARLHASLLAPPPPGDDPWTEALRWAEGRLELGVSVADLARHLGISVRSCNRGLSERFGVAPGTLLRDQRLHRARGLLESTTLSVDQVALHCGWRSRPAFAAAFTSRFGLPPGTWRQQQATIAEAPAGLPTAPPQPRTERLLRPK